MTAASQVRQASHRKGFTAPREAKAYEVKKVMSVFPAKTVKLVKPVTWALLD